MQENSNPIENSYEVTVCDSTLRDGSHSVDHQFTEDQVRLVSRALDEARVPVIEISHGDGLGGSSIQYGFSKVDEQLLIEAALDELSYTKLAVLLLPGIGTLEDLKPAIDKGAEIVRIATHCTEADSAQEHIRYCSDVDQIDVVGFLMMAHMEAPSVIAEQGKMMDEYGADIIYVVDSAGAMTPDMVKERIVALDAAVDAEVGFHGHNNLGLSVANSLTAIREGATWVDGSLRGFGAGAGNTPTEVLTTVLDKVGIETGIDLYDVMDVAEDVAADLLPEPIVIDRDSLSLGYSGSYSSFLHHAQKASEKFDVEVRDILVELGNREMVGGQEDMIIDVAVELAEQSTQPEPETTVTS